MNLKLALVIGGVALGGILFFLPKTHVSNETAQEETKHGFEPESLLQFLEERPPSTYPNLRPCGLMGMATLSDQNEDARPEFAFLKNFSDRVKQRFYAKDSGFDVLSMGMSGDYSIALQEGSTMLRIGSLLFER